MRSPIGRLSKYDERQRLQLRRRGAPRRSARRLLADGADAPRLRRAGDRAARRRRRGAATIERSEAASVVADDVVVDGAARPATGPPPAPTRVDQDEARARRRRSARCGRELAERGARATWRRGRRAFSLTCCAIISMTPAQPHAALPGAALGAELRAEDLVVERLVGEQLLVRAARDDLAVVEHEDEVGVAHRRDALRDDERGAARSRISRSSASWICHLGLGVDGRGAVVEDEEARVGEQRARDGDALPLPAREADAALADDGVVALRAAPSMKLARLRRVGRGADLRRASRRGGRRRCCRARCRRRAAPPAGRCRSARAGWRSVTSRTSWPSTSTAPPVTS